MVRAANQPKEGGPLRVILVDDDDMFREALRNNLKDAGLDVLAFGDSRVALEHLKVDRSATLALLDWKMPVMSGIELLRKMRQSEIDVPVVFLTVLGEPFYEETALADGAVDFIDKSRTFTIIQKRIEMILARSRDGTGAATGSEAEGEPVTIGHLELNPISCRAVWKGRQVDLTVAEFAVVEHLARNAGQDVRYRDLYNAVRGPGFAAGFGSEGYRANVRSFVKRIRQKFRDLDDTFECIENYPGFGYRWSGNGPPH
ncbi:response regulator transcription factor [Reyranella sp. CPCC 100927]|uniref:response regulator transcription factor n=1 Tax=Reyranella sp. CPCC 100927 TaxID=2599616 RepID=UPI0011B7FDBA|nr:response regulator transcription factor [Reyranella sp. CPCC 100927]TWT10226.1 response regulator transcription factor [Reyranella sp. CPCC 100927]